MKLGIELIASHPTTLRLGTFFETWIATPSGTVRRSFGRDEYHLKLRMETDRRLAATGRTHICQVDLEEAGLGPNGAREPILVEADLTPGSPLLWGIRTNLFLNLSQLAEGSYARLLHGDGPPERFPLDHPLLLREEVAPGRYIVDVSRLLDPGRT
ncbi:MAG: hypothetical protein ACM3XM_13915 [Mycobacterium leprae]